VGFERWSTAAVGDRAGLMCNPQIMLLDEPTEGIQPSIVQEIEDTLKRINREKGITVLVVEQRLTLPANSLRSFHHGKRRNRG
jgi:urea transport system ATP-binding protein